MDTGIVTILSVQAVTLSVMIALFWGLMKVLRQDIREVKDDLGSDLRDLDGHVRKLQVDMVLVKKDVTLLKYDVAVLKNDMTAVKHKVVVLEKNMTAVHEHLGIEGAEIPPPPPQGPVPPPVLVVE